MGGIVVAAGVAYLLVLMAQGFRFRFLRPRAAVKSAFRAAAQALGIDCTGRRLIELEARGKVDGFDLVAGPMLSEMGFNALDNALADTTHIRVYLGDGFPADFAVTDPLSEHQATEIVFGDRPFDDAVTLHGTPEALLTILGPEQRRALEQAVHAGIVVESRHVSLRYDGLPTDAKELTRQFEQLLTLARTLAGSGSPSNTTADRIAEHARVERLPAILQQQLAALADHGRSSDAILRAARKHVDHPIDAVRVEAARCLGPEGFGTLLSTLETPNLDIRVTATATIALGASPATPHRERAFDLARHRLGQLLGRTDEETNEVICRALVVLGGQGAESDLIAALGVAPQVLRRPMAEALGLMGTVRAVPALARWTEHAPIDYACQSAIAAIQDRAGPSNVGGLALVAPDEAGQLALASDPGQVSFVPEE